MGLFYGARYAPSAPKPSDSLGIVGVNILLFSQSNYFNEKVTDVDAVGAAKYSGAVSLFLIAAMHANWARGSSWPAADERRLADAVIGWEKMPSAGACLVVAGLLTLGGNLVAGWPGSKPRLQRIGAAGVSATLAVRGLVGGAGLMLRTSETFLRWNRRLYSPLCLLLAACSAAGAVPRH